MNFLLMHLRRAAIVAAAAFVAYKLLIAGYSRMIPGQPFYGFHARDWIGWLLSPAEAAFIVGVAIVEYVVLSFALARMLRTTAALIVWGAVFGCYVGLLTYPIDAVSRLDNYFPSHGFLAAVLTVVEIGVLGIAVPLGLAAVIGRRRAITVNHP